MSSEKPEDSFDDTMAELLNLMKAPPTQTAANDLMLFYTESVEAHPSRADVLASTLQDLHHPLYTPIVDSDDESPSLADMLSFELAQFHSQGLSIDEDGIPIASSDLYLINCLLSGMSFKYRLAACPEQFANIMKGLDALPDNSSASELLVVGACIQLLTGGSGIFNTAKPIQYSMTEVATKLRFQKSVGTVKASNALKLLDVCQDFLIQ
ncbi:hypothetical protein M413DRAFT_27603 [Hebeloma cylindrosporum]|uniref:Transcription factor domain-containing protein n=1 Tax=Hebeloma cylindrosporum TaxID=76867 RepID=A0A0C3CAG9_HEBCY|nr:hypothetical protein M413DRAFT_27603 [Hebeloma cylindrosporum h7]